MSTIRKELVNAAIFRVYNLVNVVNNLDVDKSHKLWKEIILDDKSLTNDEKFYAMNFINLNLDYNKLLFNKGKKRICENCQNECLAILYCEHCVRNYLKSKFLNWSSGNNDIDNLIQRCQIETIRPRKIIEWIPYNKLKNIEYLTKGGCSEIYTAIWINGSYEEWDSKEKQLKRLGEHNVILKKLKNVKNANKTWLDESESHLNISIKWGGIVPCYGLTKDPSDGNYMLVMKYFDMDLRKYLQQNHNKLTWKERIQVVKCIVDALYRIHKGNSIHKNLHSGNVLYHQTGQLFRINDLGFCGPADRPLNSSIYGNLPYIAPEVIAGKEATFASDIYSFGMLMWEISSGQTPFNNYENDYDLAINIINGTRPKIIPGTSLEYEKLMEQCWDADPTKRPNIKTLNNKIKEIGRLNHQDMLDELNKSSKQKTNNTSTLEITNSFETSYTNSRLFTSKVYQFGDLLEQKNATEEFS